MRLCLLYLDSQVDNFIFWKWGPLQNCLTFQKHTHFQALHWKVNVLLPNSKIAGLPCWRFLGYRTKISKCLIRKLIKAMINVRAFLCHTVLCRQRSWDRPIRRQRSLSKCLNRFIVLEVNSEVEQAWRLEDLILKRRLQLCTIHYQG
jgi:hypothetical protein